jgi:hypothetical protein
LHRVRMDFDERKRTKNERYLVMKSFYDLVRVRLRHPAVRTFEVRVLYETDRSAWISSNVIVHLTTPRGVVPHHGSYHGRREGTPRCFPLRHPLGCLGYDRFGRCHELRSDGMLDFFADDAIDLGKRFFIERESERFG